MSSGPICIRFHRCYDGMANILLYARRIGPAMFEGEALSLKAMYDTKSIRVPLPYKVRKDSDAIACISCAMHKTVQDTVTHLQLLNLHYCAHTTQILLQFRNKTELDIYNDIRLIAYSFLNYSCETSWLLRFLGTS